MKLGTPEQWYRYDVKFTLKLLEVFIENVETQIETEIKNFETKKETHVLEEDPEYGARVVNVHKGLDSDTWSLEDLFNEHFPNLSRRSALITLFGFLEHELDKLSPKLMD